MNRRGFLGVLAKAPVVGPLLGRQIAQDTALRLADVHGLAAGNPESSPPPAGSNDNITASNWRRLLKLAHVRKEAESILFEDERRVRWLDADLAVNRSFSLMAKVTFQRQRNVARRLDDLQVEAYPWQRLTQMAARLIGF